MMYNVYYNWQGTGDCNVTVTPSGGKPMTVTTPDGELVTVTGARGPLREPC